MATSKKNLHVKEMIMNEGKALFVPRNSFGGYNMAVNIIRSGEGRCLAYLIPVPGKDFFIEEDFSLLAGFDEPRMFPVTVGKVLFRKNAVPEHEIELVRDRRTLSFDEAVEFMTSISGFKQI